MALNAKMGAGPLFAWAGSNNSTLTGTTFNLNANFVNATSGSALCCRFSSPVTQASGALTVYAFMTTKTGSPTAMKVAVFAGPSGVMDPQRPDTGAALATSAAVDVSAQTNNTWTTFSLTGLSLTLGASYFIVLFNDTGTPGSNHSTYMSRGWNGGINTARFKMQTTADGFTTDPSDVNNSSEPVFVTKFNDGTFLGNPFTVQQSHASNANDRGNRYNFSASVQVVGISYTGVSTLATAVKIYQGSTEIASATLDRFAINNSCSVYFDAPVTLSPATDYDVVFKYSGSTTVMGRIDAGTSPPADVISCMPSGLSYVDGATPGSYAETDGFTAIMLLINDFPAAAGSSYTGFMLT